MSKRKLKSVKQWNKELNEYQLKHQGFTGSVYRRNGTQVIYHYGKIVNTKWNKE